jgi:6-pyruvoyltetrahydropterin/6-carboxytetrahydropterin synthase
MDYVGPCQHPHGHNAKVEIHLASEKLDPRDVVYDFGDLKELVQKWVDQKLDHRMILRKDDPLVKILQEINEPVFVLEMNPTAEAIARLIYEYCVSQKLPVEEVRFWETPSSFAAYRL